ncbi:hypothetical protein THICB2_880035 [Thiomonas sp. CB2]|nr:hypothetical protein THICB2_880035 [Thiomonas sp. CB2]
MREAVWRRLPCLRLLVSSKTLGAQALPFRPDFGHVERGHRAAAESLLKFGAQPFELGAAQVFLVLQQAQTVTHHFADVVVPARRDLDLDELFKVGAEGNTGGHGNLLSTNSYDPLLAHPAPQGKFQHGLPGALLQPVWPASPGRLGRNLAGAPCLRCSRS